MQVVPQLAFIQALGAQRRARLHALRAHGPQSFGAHKALQLYKMGIKTV